MGVRSGRRAARFDPVRPPRLAVFEVEMNCASCSTPLPDNALFCPGCGQRILGQRRPAVASPSSLPPAAAPSPAPAPRALAPEELQAAIAARQELGTGMDEQLVETFLDRVEQGLDARIDARISQRLRRGGLQAQSRANAMTGRIAASLGLGIPITAIAGGIGHLPGIIVAWAGIVILNIYYTEVEKSNRT